MNTSDLLDRYNAWRKGEIWRPDSNEGPSPKDITAAIAEGAAAIRELAALRADLEAAKAALENQIAHTTAIANTCARQRAWIDEVMAQEFWEDIVFEDSVIFRPAPFEDK